MQSRKHVVSMIMAMIAVTSCGKNPQKKSVEQAPKDQLAEKSDSYERKKVSNTTSNFTMKPSLVSCEDFRKRLVGRLYEFTIPFKNAMGDEQVEDAKFFFRDVVCNPESDRFMLMTSSHDSKGFHVTFDFSFAKDAGTLVYGMDDCFGHVHDRMYGRFAYGHTSISPKQQITNDNIVNDHYCIPAIDQLAQAIVKDLRI
jgi:hypothetical protein